MSEQFFEKKLIKFINSYLKKLYCDLLEASNHTDEFYDFFEKNNEYFLKVKGIKRLFFNGILTSTFKVEFGGNTQKYIIIHRCNNFQLLYSSGYEAEIFEFMVKKLNCVPQKLVKEI